MLNELQRFDAIKELNEIVIEYKANGTANITFEQKLMLKEVYLSIYDRNTNMDLSCSQCVLTYIIFIHNWYVREFPLWLAKQVGEPTPTPAEAVEGLNEPVLSDSTGGEPVAEAEPEPEQPAADEPVANEPQVDEVPVEVVEPVQAEPAAEQPTESTPAADETPIEPVAEQPAEAVEPAQAEPEPVVTEPVSEPAPADETPVSEEPTVAKRRR